VTMRDVEDSVLTCANCEGHVREEDAWDAGWLCFSDGVELLPFCAPCIEREFSAGPASTDWSDEA
jgi:hypothetical protein